MAAPPRLVPPITEPPLDAEGAHTGAWVEHHQGVADQLAALRVALAAAIGDNTGTIAGDDAAAGQIGEYLSVTVAPAGVSLTNAVAANVASLVLPAGDWDASGNVLFSPAATTNTFHLVACLSLASATFANMRTQIPAPFSFPSTLAIGTGGTLRVSISAPATVYLVAFASFSVSTMQASGMIGARRVR